ncbi:MAG: hypothetical protein EU548_03310 [Promethearchaeota archaeon]|nr:MAG: hypothetical protein EU548_03310 [Candidatus Lokiarchaeota archaeon]
MVDTHRYSFFGKKTGIILSSASRTEPFIMLTCIREKANESWEKPSQNEGKMVRISLEEMIEILRVLDQKTELWSTIHKYKNETTKISFKWNNNTHSALLINIGKYPKMLGYAQTELLRLLLRHLLKEKIHHATIPKKIDSNAEKNESQAESQEEEKRESDMRTVTLKAPNNQTIPMKEEVIQKDRKDESMLVKGAFMGETEKAVLIGLEPDKAVWFPKSTVRSPYEKEKFLIQRFMIDTWVLKKNQVVS